MSGPSHEELPHGEIPETIAHYRILQRLGKGGMGEVFLGEDTRQHGRKVALKILPPELTKDDSRVRRFKQEARGVLGAPGSGPLPKEAVESNPEVAGSLGFAYAIAGKRREAEEILQRLHKLSEKRYISPRYMAIINVGLNHQAEAIEQLQKAYESRHPGLVLIRIDPIFDRLRSEDGFKQLVKRFEPIP